MHISGDCVPPVFDKYKCDTLGNVLISFGLLECQSFEKSLEQIL